MIFAIMWSVIFAINLCVSGYLLYQSAKDQGAAESSGKLAISSDEVKMSKTLKMLAQWTIRAELVRFVTTLGFLMLGVTSILIPENIVFQSLVTPVLVLGGFGILLNTMFTFAYRYKLYQK